MAGAAIGSGLGAEVAGSLLLGGIAGLITGVVVGGLT